MPGAWEIMKVRRQRVLVVIISPPELRHSRHWCKAFRALQLPPESEISYVEGFPYDAARNIALRVMLDGGFPWVYFWDSDTIPPDDTVLRLIETGRDLIGALYTRRGPPFSPVGGNEVFDPEGRSTGFGMPAHQKGDVVPVQVLGMGATLISRRCVESIMAKYPRPFAWGLDLASIKEEDGSLIPRTSEDYVFCLRAAEVGYQPWIHTGIEARHEFLAMSTPNGPEMPD